MLHTETHLVTVIIINHYLGGMLRQLDEDEGKVQNRREDGRREIGKCDEELTAHNKDFTVQIKQTTSNGWEVAAHEEELAANKGTNRDGLWF